MVFHKLLIFFKTRELFIHQTQRVSKRRPHLLRSCLTLLTSANAHACRNTCYKKSSCVHKTKIRSHLLLAAFTSANAQPRISNIRPHLLRSCLMLLTSANAHASKHKVNLPSIKLICSQSNRSHFPSSHLFLFTWCLCGSARFNVNFSHLMQL